MTPPKRPPADDKPEPPRDPAALVWAVLDTWPRRSQAHAFWLHAGGLRALCGQRRRRNDAGVRLAIATFGRCAVCSERLQRIREKHDEDHTSPPATGV